MYVHEFKDDVHAGLVSRQGYIPKKHFANQTKNYLLKKCISWGLVD
jgi:hypothetical protein